MKFKEFKEKVSEEKTLIESKEKVIKDLNKKIDDMIKSKDKNGLDILIKELDKILKKN